MSARGGVRPKINKMIKDIIDSRLEDEEKNQLCFGRREAKAKEESEFDRSDTKADDKWKII